MSATGAGPMDQLIGVGLYTPAEAGSLLRIPVLKISRWLKGHSTKKKSYDPLWTPEIDLGDDRLFLGFRELMEVRVADAFISAGVSAMKVRKAISVARDTIGFDYPLSSARFRTDGREIFLQIIEVDEKGEERERLLNLFRKQYEFKSVIDPILKTMEFGEDGTPVLWWPEGRKAKIVVDPSRAFGQPIDAVSSVPTAILAAAAKQEGVRGTAIAYDVPLSSVHRAVSFERSLEQRMAA